MGAGEATRPGTQGKAESAGRGARDWLIENRGRASFVALLCFSRSSRSAEAGHPTQNINSDQSNMKCVHRSTSFF